MVNFTRPGRFAPGKVTGSQLIRACMCSTVGLYRFGRQNVLLLPKIGPRFLCLPANALDNVPTSRQHSTDPSFRVPPVMYKRILTSRAAVIGAYCALVHAVTWGVHVLRSPNFFSRGMEADRNVKVVGGDEAVL